MFPLAGGAIPGILSGISSLFGGDDGDYQQRLQADTQREFAQMGIRWRVEDAKAAGLHPLAAIGAAGASYSPTVVAGEPNFASRLGSLAEPLRQMGQNTKRAEVVTQTPMERELEALALRRAQLQNQLLEGQIASEWASVMGQPPQQTLPAVVAPARPATVRGPSGLPVAKPGAVRAVPSESISSAPGDFGLEAGASPGFKQFNIGKDWGMELPNTQLAEIMENMGIAGHVLMPGIMAARGTQQYIDTKASRKSAGPPYPSPAPNKKWFFNNVTGQWVLQTVGPASMYK